MFWYFVEIVKEFDGSFYANMRVKNDSIEGLPEYVTYPALKKAIKTRTGITLPPLKALQFTKSPLCRKHYAIVDATHDGEARIVPSGEVLTWNPA